jgi:hypothetical protein
MATELHHSAVLCHMEGAYEAETLPRGSVTRVDCSPAPLCGRVINGRMRVSIASDQIRLSQWAIAGREMTLWVRSCRFTMAAQRPLTPRKQPDRCVALSDAQGHERHFALRQFGKIQMGYLATRC